MIQFEECKKNNLLVSCVIPFSSDWTWTIDTLTPAKNKKVNADV